MIFVTSYFKTLHTLQKNISPEDHVPVKHNTVDQRTVYPRPISTPPSLGRFRQELEQRCEHGDVKIEQRVWEQVVAHGVPHTPVPVDTAEVRTESPRPQNEIRCDCKVQCRPQSASLLVIHVLGLSLQSSLKMSALK